MLHIRQLSLLTQYIVFVVIVVVLKVDVSRLCLVQLHGECRKKKRDNLVKQLSKCARNRSLALRVGGLKYCNMLICMSNAVE